MKREILLSMALHLVILALAVLSSPFDTTRAFDYDDVIRIKAVALPDFAPAVGEPVATEPVAIPQAIADETPEIPINDPTTIDEPKQIEKPKPKPPQEEPPKQSGQTVPAGNGENGKKEIDVEGSGPGSPFASATVDNANFNYPYWFTQTFNKLASNFRNTVVIEGRVVCIVYFQVIRSGRLTELKVEQSSGIPAFDQACLSAIERSAPFPPLPREFREEIIGISVPFTNSSR